MSELRWTHEQFDEMSWHDNHVHAMRIIVGEHGAGELVLDIDYIADWLRNGDAFQFRLVPAALRFTDVTNLSISLDYASPSAALAPFSIHAIERRTEQRERYVAHVWRIEVNWPRGELSFEANGYEQTATGKAVVSYQQCLSPAERNAA
jgi:hypothetical protein